jgi:cobalt-zinc-cadmium resistance protein CzcA
MQAALPGVTFNFSQNIQDNIEEAISGVKGANSVKIIGPNLAVLEDLASQVEAQMAQVRGVEDLGIFHVLGQPNLDIKIDRARAARYGLNSGDVNTVIQAAMGGAVASQVLEGDRSFNLTVRLAPQYRTASRRSATSRSATRPTPAPMPTSRCASWRR